MRNRLLGLLAFLVLSTHSFAASPAETRQAMAKAIEWLYEEQDEQGSWERGDFAPFPEGRVSAGDFDTQREGQWGGRTALSVYALLAAGEPTTDPRLKKGINFMLDQPVRGTYACGIRLLACTYLPQTDRVREVVAADTRTLQAGLITQGLAAGHWDYIVGWVRPVSGTFRYSHSRGQYGVLGLDAAMNLGWSPPRGLWQTIDSGWRRNQESGGGWGYMHPDSPGNHSATPGMTAAGVASLYITTRRNISGAACEGNNVDLNLAGGLAFLAANTDKWLTDAEYPRDFPLATAYAIERVGVASGLRTIGGDDWYEKGRDWLVKNQSSSGTWKSDYAASGSHGSVCFGLLFLARGSSPLVVQKLAHADDDEAVAASRRLNQMAGREAEPDASLGRLLVGDWHQRPLDLAGLARFAGDADEQELHWQIIDADAPLEAWLDAPMLVLSGSDAPSLDEATRRKLREFVLRGGLIYANADCGRGGFTKEIRQLGTELFPDLAWRVAEASSPIYKERFPINGRRPPQLMALGNGVRDFIVLADQEDLAAAWQQSLTGQRQARDEVDLQLGANLLAVANGYGELPLKGERRAPVNEQAARTVRIGHVLPQQVEPEALSQVARFSAKIEAVEEVDAEFDVLFLNGTGDFTLDADAGERIRRHVDAGKLLIVEAVGADTAFATAADRELRKLFGDEADQLDSPLPLTHPLVAPLTGTTFWKPAAAKAFGSFGAAPRLRGIERDGKLVVLFSREDLSTAAAGSHWPLVGYTPDAARKILAMAMLLAID
jgi:hypothetical protein